MLRIVMLDGVGEGERSCPQFPLTAPSPLLPSFSYYSCVSVGGERCIQPPLHARSTALIFRFLREREGDGSFPLSPSRSSHLLKQTGNETHSRPQALVHALRPTVIA